MGTPSCMRSVVDRNVVMRRIPVFWDRLLLSLPAMLWHQRVVFDYKPKQVIYIYAFADDDYVPSFVTWQHSNFDLPSDTFRCCHLDKQSVEEGIKYSCGIICTLERKNQLAKPSTTETYWVVWQEETHFGFFVRAEILEFAALPVVKCDLM